MNPEVRDRARVLMKICRFAGRTKRFYSVLEHTVLGVEVMENLGYSHDDRKAFLYHDFEESEFGDIIRPVKRLLPPSYHAMVARWNESFAATVGISNSHLLHGVTVNMIDDAMLATELELLALIDDTNHPFDIKNRVHFECYRVLTGSVPSGPALWDRFEGLYYDLR